MWFPSTNVFSHFIFFVGWWCLALGYIPGMMFVEVLYIYFNPTEFGNRKTPYHVVVAKNCELAGLDGYLEVIIKVNGGGVKAN